MYFVRATLQPSLGGGALKMQDQKMQDRLWIRRTVDVSYNEQHYSDNHCEYGASVPRVQTLLRPWTVAARYTEAPYAWCCVCTNKVPANNFCENLARNLTSNVMLCAILWTDVYMQTVADCFITTYNRINFATSTSMIN